MKSSISASISSSRMALAAGSMSIIMARWKWATGRLLRPDAGTSHVAGQWGSSAPVRMVDPGRGTRCAIRDTGAPGEGRYHWTVTLFGEPDPIASGLAGGLGEARAEGRFSPMWRAATGRPVAGSATMADPSLAPLRMAFRTAPSQRVAQFKPFRRVQTRDEIEEAGRSPQLVQ
jgi:hypothetical protein